MPTFDDLVTACLERDPQGLALCAKARLSINRKDHEENPLWFLILGQADRKPDHEQRVKECMAIFWNQGLRLDRTTNKGVSLVDYLARSCDPEVARFMLTLPRAVERFSKYVNKQGDPKTQQWWAARMTEVQASCLDEATRPAAARPRTPRL
jgi:hypothetical protein